VTCLLDTHFLIWIIRKSRRLRNYPWLNQYEPWGVSPFSLLEIQLLSEAGRIPVRNPQFEETVMSDTRFEVDEVSLVAVIQKALPFAWTRDPFDRLLAAHSQLRRVPLCTVDSTLLDYHKSIVVELR